MSYNELSIEERASIQVGQAKGYVTICSTDAYVCRKTIYTAIYALPVGHLGKELSHGFRAIKNTRKPHYGEEGRHGQVPNIVSIHLHPPEVSKREMPGHWEGDLIKSKNNASALDTLPW